jgi:hypothetical protein
VFAGPVAGRPDEAALRAELADRSSDLHGNADVRYFLDEVAPLLDGESARWSGSVADGDDVDVGETGRGPCVPSADPTGADDAHPHGHDRLSGSVPPPTPSSRSLPRYCWTRLLAASDPAEDPRDAPSLQQFDADLGHQPITHAAALT